MGLLRENWVLFQGLEWRVVNWEDSWVHKTPNIYLEQQYGLCKTTNPAVPPLEQL